MAFIDTDFGQPLIFRTVDENVFKASIEEGSIWLRSNEYYQTLENKARQDTIEGISGTAIENVIQFKGLRLQTTGNGLVGTKLPFHYIMSLHGVGIRKDIMEGFGGHTFGIRCLSKLAVEVLYQVSQKIKVHGYSYGQVSYQHTTLSKSRIKEGQGGILKIGEGDQAESIQSFDPNCLRKSPEEPFIGQDEWRIVIFSDEIYKGDLKAPLDINVDPSHFFPI
ncbi:hypothetical protein [Alteromonas mediterranea]|jgi:hypothetical protein|uniref:hypothetical protein n=1 Tax=Alteromonas mediterranea TaxID=314275 RepID=UPI0003557042|nr:hypothetical protein [Alteromonas mediterranea]AGP85698.1 hypothetical protein I607_09515 [Alteromonas mediterranea U4]AGP89834.1 hypothetical protein I876_09865 [Alteromonas mediterranea U7]AGP93697.1 hypothetical protein I634_09920 [Alteromonas mediterranea U8]